MEQLLRALRHGETTAYIIECIITAMQEQKCNIYTLCYMAIAHLTTQERVDLQNVVIGLLHETPKNLQKLNIKRKLTSGRYVFTANTSNQ